MADVKSIQSFSVSQMALDNGIHFLWAGRPLLLGGGERFTLRGLSSPSNHAASSAISTQGNPFLMGRAIPFVSGRVAFHFRGAQQPTKPLCILHKTHKLKISQAAPHLTPSPQLRTPYHSHESYELLELSRRPNRHTHLKHILLLSSSISSNIFFSARRLRHRRHLLPLVSAPESQFPTT